MNAAWRAATFTRGTYSLAFVPAGGPDAPAGEEHVEAAASPVGQQLLVRQEPDGLPPAPWPARAVSPYTWRA